MGLHSWEQFNWRGSKPVTGDATTFHMAEDFLKGLDVEDWGCGVGYFKTIHKGGYFGIDGSKTPAVDLVCDLAEARLSKTGSILIRHVLEHNENWETILAYAVAQFTKRLVVILFTPWAPWNDRPQVLSYTGSIPAMALPRPLFLSYFEGLHVEGREGLQTKTQYGIEHVFMIERG